MQRRVGPLLSGLLFVFSAFTFADSVGSTKYDRLVAVTKLWAYIKYCHPAVTAQDVDWDAAWIRIAPRVLAAQGDREFSAAVDELLSALHDPETHVLREEPAMSRDAKARPVVTEKDGVTLVRMEDGLLDARRAGAEVARKAAGKGPVVFDLRGSRTAGFVLPAMAVREQSTGPSRMTRAHSGYANDANLGTGGYSSYWETRDGLTLPVGMENAIRPVFLVDLQTALPEWALAAQASGAGAILSEGGFIDEGQLDLVQRWDLSPGVAAAVRVAVLAYSDGTTGVSANLILKETGDAALRTAITMAKRGTWPAPGPRRRLRLPMARFGEKTDTGQLYPDKEHRLLAAARIWGVFHYFHPYRQLYHRDWDMVLQEMFPKMESASSALEYHKAWLRWLPKPSTPIATCRARYSPSSSVQHRRPLSCDGLKSSRWSPVFLILFSP